MFALMFLAGAIRAMREEPGAARASATNPPAISERVPTSTPTPASAVAEAPVAVAEAPTAMPAASAAEPTASAEPSRSSATTVRVLLRSAASGATFSRNGKQIGMNSVIVELAPGETRAFDVELAGHVSRTVTVDGSSSEVVVILPRVREAPAPAPAGPAPTPTGVAASAPSETVATP